MTLARIIANEMGVDFRMTSGTAIEKQDDLVTLLSDLHEGDVLFIDEIHRLTKQMMEILRSMPLSKCTLIGTAESEKQLSA